MELEQTKAEYEKRGLNVASMSRDSVAVVKHFSERRDISFPMLTDDGTIAREFGILNHNYEPGTSGYGLPFPGTFILDENRVVQAKFFESDHTERYTAASMLVSHFGDADGEPISTVETRHLKLTASASDETVYPGSLTTLIIDVEMDEKMHVYAPGVEGGFIPIAWNMEDSSAWVTLEAGYPESHSVYLEAIDETVPVYEGRFRIQRGIVIGRGDDFQSAVAGGKIMVKGSFRYQACDDRMCYPPETVPLEWTFSVGALDSERVPEELRE